MFSPICTQTQINIPSNFLDFSLRSGVSQMVGGDLPTDRQAPTIRKIQTPTPTHTKPTPTGWCPHRPEHKHKPDTHLQVGVLTDLNTNTNQTHTYRFVPAMPIGGDLPTDSVGPHRPEHKPISPTLLPPSLQYPKLIIAIFIKSSTAPAIIFWKLS